MGIKFKNKVSAGDPAAGDCKEREILLNLKSGEVYSSSDGVNLVKLGGGGYTVKNVSADTLLNTEEVISAKTLGTTLLAPGVVDYTLTLPLAPVDGDIIQVVDGSGNSQDRPILIARNGKTIAGLADDLTCDVNYFDIKLIYRTSDSNWVLGGK